MPLNTLTRDEHLLIASTLMHCLKEASSLNVKLACTNESVNEIKEALAKFIIDSREEV